MHFPGGLYLAPPLFHICAPAVSENIQRDPSRFRERCVKSFLRHHLPRAAAEKPVAFVDPYLDIGPADTVPSFNCGKPPVNIARHYRLPGCIRRRRGGVVLPTSRKYRAIASLGVSLVQSSERLWVEQEFIKRL